MQRRWITCKEAGEYLSLNEKTVYRQASAGIIPSAKIGGSIRIDKMKLDEQLEAQERSLDGLAEKVLG